MMKAPKHFIQIPVITARQSDISSTDKLVFGEIYTMLNTNDKCWLTNTGIGDRINKNKATVKNSVKKLRKFGYIKTKIVPNGREHSKRYVYADELGGAKFGTTKSSRTKKSPSVGLNKARRSYQIKSPSKSQSTSVSRSIERKKRQVDWLLNFFQKLFVTPPDERTQQVFNRWLAQYSPARIIKAMKVTKKNCRNGNPRAIASYINGCIKYPMRPKKQRNVKSRGDNNGDEKYNHKAIFK